MLPDWRHRFSPLLLDRLTPPNNGPNPRSISPRLTHTILSRKDAWTISLTVFRRLQRNRTGALGG